MTFGVKLKKIISCVNERGIRAVDTCSTKKCTLSGLIEYNKTKQLLCVCRQNVQFNCIYWAAL